MSDDPAQADPWQAADRALGAWSRLTAAEDAATPSAATRSVAAAGARVELREITGDSVRAICRLAVAQSQAAFVAPNAVSLAEALFEPSAWYRAIYADEVPVGFVMLSIDSESEKPTYYLWRLMIAEGHQHKGYGRAALALVVEHVRSLPNATELVVSWVPAEGGPEAFYVGLGFVPTGEIHHGEVEARLVLDPPS